MTELIRLADKNGETIFLLTNNSCLVLGVLIIFGGLAIVTIGVALINVGVRLS